MKKREVVISVHRVLGGVWIEEENVVHLHCFMCHVLYMTCWTLELLLTEQEFSLELVEDIISFHFVAISVKYSHSTYGIINRK